MAVLSKPHRIKVVQWFFEMKSIKAVQRRFFQELMDKPPSYKAISKLIEKFNETGSVLDKRRSGRPKTVKSMENVARVEDCIRVTPTKSLRKVASDTGIRSHTTVSQILKSLSYKPYKPSVVHHMTNIDHQRRQTFCMKMLDLIRGDPNVLDNIIFSDESIFALDKSVSAHNTYSWQKQNPYVYIEKKLQPSRVVVWCGLSKNHLIGPYFFESTVSGDSYLKMLKTYMIPCLRRRGLLDMVTFQQDGAAPHTAHAVLDYLKKKFPERLISFRTDMMWPPRSPDLNPLDFHTWGHLKGMMKDKEWTTIGEMKTDITCAVNRINRDKNLLQRVIGNFRYRLEQCLAEGGRHFQHKL